MTALELIHNIHSDANPKSLTLYTRQTYEDKNLIPYVYHFAVNQLFSPTIMKPNGYGYNELPNPNINGTMFLHASAIIPTKRAKKF
jgi:hypothetical protein